MVFAAAQVTAVNVDIARIAPTYHLYTKDEIEEVVSRVLASGARRSLWPHEL